MDIDMSPYRAVVCGASKGIGRACAIELAQLGAELLLVARSEQALAELCDSLPGSGHSYLTLDMSNTADLKEKFPEALGDKGAQILIHNCGGPAAGPLIEAGEEQLEEAFTQHIVSAQLMAKAMISGMKERNYGRIIHVISTSVKAPIPNLGVSNTIRGAMASWAKSMANELAGFGITVNNVLPGYTATSRLDALLESASKRTSKPVEQVEKEWKAKVPAGRFGKPEELAQAVAFLASPAASYINGINLPVDGGRTPSL